MIHADEIFAIVDGFDASGYKIKDNTWISYKHSWIKLDIMIMMKTDW